MEQPDPWHELNQGKHTVNLLVQVIVIFNTKPNPRKENCYMKSTLSNRKWISVITAMAFLVVSVTGLFLALHIGTKSVAILHEWFGYALMAAAAMHLLVNRKAFTAYLRERSSMILSLVSITILATVFFTAGVGDDHKRSHQLLQVFDVNANGVIDAEETSMAADSLKKLDVNRDGGISAEELLAEHGKHGAHP